MKYLYGTIVVGLYVSWLSILALIENPIFKSLWALVFIPLCIVGYFCGKKDVRRERRLNQRRKRTNG